MKGRVSCLDRQVAQVFGSENDCAAAYNVAGNAERSEQVHDRCTRGFRKPGVLPSRGCRHMICTWVRTVVVTLIPLVGAGCATPARDFSARATALGLQRDVVPGSDFHHVVFRRFPGGSRTLHVYIDGDGMPWGAWRPAADPTPRNPMVLELMARDSEPSLYLGRPCYHGLARTPPCTSAFWTSQRYSEAIVASMAAALRQLLAATHIERLIWLGYSGGGTLAVLLAARFPESAAVVTVAANLDIDVWADWHGYPRLVGSLNPARLRPLPAGIHQRHYVGDRDRVIPSYVVTQGAADATSVTVIANYDHVCCWIDMWPRILRDVDKMAGAD